MKQDPGSSLTLSGQALSGVAITSQSVSLSGDLVLDLTGIDLYDGMTFTLINASSITGVWSHVDIVGSYTECNEVRVNVGYTQGSAVATLSSVNVCDSASKLIACVASLV